MASGMTTDFGWGPFLRYVYAPSAAQGETMSPHRFSFHSRATKLGLSVYRAHTRRRRKLSGL